MVIRRWKQNLIYVGTSGLSFLSFLVILRPYLSAEYKFRLKQHADNIENEYLGGKKDFIVRIEYFTVW